MYVNINFTGVYVILTYLFFVNHVVVSFYV